MKLQIDRMIAKFFSSLPVDEQLNFSVAVTVMSVQRKWRQRMKAHKVWIFFCCSKPMCHQLLSSMSGLDRQAGLSRMATTQSQCINNHIVQETYVMMHAMVAEFQFL